MGLHTANPTMRRSIRSILAGIATSLILTACQDGPTAPIVEPADRVEMPDLRIFADYSADRQSADIRVTHGGGWFVLGPHSIHFPKGSICSPESSYGPTEWDKPCEPAREPMNFHVEIERDALGRSWLSFSPAVRFVPSTKRSKWVMLFMNAGGTPQSIHEAMPKILWSPEAGGEPVDESLTDPTLVTRVIPGTTIAYRRIKHFSSYQVGMGFSDTSEELGTGEGGSQVP